MQMPAKINKKMRGANILSIQDPQRAQRSSKFSATGPRPPQANCFSPFAGCNGPRRLSRTHCHVIQTPPAERGPLTNIGCSKSQMPSVRERKSGGGWETDPFPPLRPLTAFYTCFGQAWFTTFDDFESSFQAHFASLNCPVFTGPNAFIRERDCTVRSVRTGRSKLERRASGVGTRAPAAPSAVGAAAVSVCLPVAHEFCGHRSS